MEESNNPERHVAEMSTFLLIGTIASFVPQYRRIRRKEDATGVSTWYLVFNTIASTEQLALLLVLSATDIPDGYDLPDTGANSLSSVQGWLDLMQMGSMWICWSGLLLLSVMYRGSSAMTKASALLVCVAWLAISLGAFIFQSLSAGTSEDPERRAQLTAAFLDWHFLVLNPCATASVLLSFFAQSHMTLWLRSRGSLSIESLASQALVFAFLASSWKKRLHPTDDASEDPHCRFITWYNSGGWAVLDSALSSLIQAYLLLLAIFAMCMGPRRRGKSKRQKRKEAKQKQREKERKKERRGSGRADETTPLLPLFHRREPPKERRRFRSFLAKLKWRRKKKMKKNASRWRRVLGRSAD
ncbi:uncharacterized protein DNG_07851 [Cephalotrichum gorgonifer]|uniref:Uncharacterized protein n=1 Tax=Cephalotrichum gorgonifer TaxID=2041049 RepID=A0AAE8N2L6_9PEZI|nr:uncharacterized protein DNG_07851 [Cephalotrichum gorgonifer]